jgi:DNA-binding GntR family transcriptional regulator
MRRIKREPAENLATAELRNAILLGLLKPGARLRQEELASRLGVSRMPIRQALSVLESEGLVHTDPWRGTVVAPLDGDSIRDLYAFRGIVEPAVADLLAQRGIAGTAALRDVINEGHEALSSGDAPRLLDLDLQFHFLLYEAIGNRVLVDVMRAQWAHVRRVMTLTLTVDGYRNKVWNEHAAIIDAIDDHDASRAAALAEAHINAASAEVMKNLDSLMNASSSLFSSKPDGARFEQLAASRSFVQRRAAKDRSAASGQSPV